MEIKYIPIHFTNGFADRVPTVTQYDYGQFLKLYGLHLPPVVEVHFKNALSEQLLVVAGSTEEGVTTVQIPNKMLNEPHNITAYIFMSDGESGRTVLRIDLNMRIRPQPQQVSTDPDDPTYISGLSELISLAAQTVEKAEKCSSEASSASADAVAAAAAAQAISDTLQPADPHYDPTSWTAQSGVAVEEALSDERSRVNGNFANALKETKSGKTVTLFNVSPVYADISVNLTSDTITDFSSVTLTKARGIHTDFNAFADRLIERAGGQISAETNLTVTTENMRNKILFDGFKPNTAYTVVLYGLYATGGNDTYLRVVYTNGTEETLCFEKDSSESYCMFKSDASKSIECIKGADKSGTGVYLYYKKCGIFEGEITRIIPNADGTVGYVSALYPTSALTTDSEDVTINCEYSKDTNALTQEIKAVADVAKEQTDALRRSVANGLIGKKSGKAFCISDFSPFNKEIKITAEKENILPKTYSISETTVGGVTFSPNANGEIVLNGVVSEDTVVLFSQKQVTLSPEKTYRISGALYEEDVEIEYKTYDQNGALLNTVTFGGAYSEEQSAVFTGAATIDLSMKVYEGTEYQNVAVAPMLLLESLSEVSIKQYGKNLFDCNAPVQSGHAKIVDNDSGEFIFVKTTGMKQIKICSSENAQYRVSGYVKGTKTQSALITFYYTDGTSANVGATTVVGEWVRINGLTKANKTVDYIMFGGSGGLGLNTAYKNLQIELNPAPTEYEVYKEPITHTFDSEGKLNINVENPSATFILDTDGVSMNAEYSRDINKAFAELSAALTATIMAE